MRVYASEAPSQGPGKARAHPDIADFVQRHANKTVSPVPAFQTFDPSVLFSTRLQNPSKPIAIKTGIIQ